MPGVRVTMGKWCVQVHYTLVKAVEEKDFSCPPRTRVRAVLFICPRLWVERVLRFHFPVTKCDFSEKTKRKLML